MQKIVVVPFFIAEPLRTGIDCDFVFIFVRDGCVCSMSSRRTEKIRDLSRDVKVKFSIFENLAR